MPEDFYQRVDGVREPDPTLGKNLARFSSSDVPSTGLPEPEPESQSETSQSETPQLKTSQPETLSIPQEKQEAPVVKPPRRQRVVLTDPRQRAGGLRARVELEEQTSWGEMLIKDLVKAQFKTGIWLFGLTLATLGALPLAFYFAPSFGGLTVVGVPLPWVLLG